MKKYCFIIILFLGCNKHNQQIKKSIVKKLETEVLEKKELKKFYECDKIEHYYLDINEDDVISIGFLKTRTKEQQLFQRLMTSNYPKSIHEINFEDKLEKFKFAKTVLFKKKKIEVENIFTQKDSLQIGYSSCVPIYRDVFLFKRNDSIVGIAKVCFGCGVSVFLGSKVDTEGFGLYTELDKLKKIIRN